MSFVGVPSAERLCFAVEIAGTNGMMAGREYVHAERVRFDGGFAEFSNGDIFASAFVAAYSGRRADSVFLMVDSEGAPCCIHLDEDDD